MFGTDFEAISRMFPGRQRRHIKLKYNRKEQQAPARLIEALVGPRTEPMDLAVLKDGRELESVEAIMSEQGRRQLEHEDAIGQAKPDEDNRKHDADNFAESEPEQTYREEMIKEEGH